MKAICLSILLCLLFASCKNSDWEFPDYPYQTVYFAYQLPVRTITLGEDIFDTSLDNAHQCEIMATTGGVYKTDQEVVIGIKVDNSLAEGQLFGKGGDEILPMPSSYYRLAADKIVIPKGKMAGGVNVQLSDAFFADPNAIKNTYVIPLAMTSVTNADSILSGKNYILYALKYINPWHGVYLRRGKDVIRGKNGQSALDKTVVRHSKYVEYDEVFKLSTQSLLKTGFSLAFKDSEGTNINCKVVLNFDDAGNFTVIAGDNSFSASGTGKFVKKGEKNSWGSKDRDALYMQYEIDLPQMHVTATDTLVLRDRGVAMEVFSPVSK